MFTSISRSLSKVKIRKGFGGKGSVYIVYMGARQHEDPNLVTASHHDMLASVLGSKEAVVESMLYSYKHGFSGFSATLTESQAKQISKIPGVISVTPRRSYELQTTRSCLDYSHPTEILSKTNQGDGVIIGVVDSGLLHFFLPLLFLFFLYYFFSFLFSISSCMRNATYIAMDICTLWLINIHCTCPAHIMSGLACSFGIKDMNGGIHLMNSQYHIHLGNRSDQLMGQLVKTTFEVAGLVQSK